MNIHSKIKSLIEKGYTPIQVEMWFSVNTEVDMKTLRREMLSIDEIIHYWGGHEIGRDNIKNQYREIKSVIINNSNINPEKFSIKEISVSTGIPYMDVTNRLRSMVNMGHIAKIGYGKYKIKDKNKN